MAALYSCGLDVELGAQCGRCGGAAAARNTLSREAGALCCHRGQQPSSLCSLQQSLGGPTWADPSCGLAGQNVRKLVKDGFIIRKPEKIHSRARARAAAEAKAKGRHTGYGEWLAGSC